MRQIISDEDSKLYTLSLNKYPDAVFTHFYIDGLIHTIDYLLLKSKSGANSCGDHLLGTLDKFDSVSKEYLSKKDYLEAAYVKGRKEALAYFISDEEVKLPIYFLFGYKNDIANFEEYSKLLASAEEFHKTAHKAAQIFIGSNYPDDIFPHHAPFI